VFESLGGTVSKRSNPAKGMFEISFNKKIGNNVLPNRIDLQLKVVPEAADSCNVMAKAYPVDPMGNKLTFGVIGNAAEVVMTTFFAALETKIEARIVHFCNN
jgi:hypothetical protein